MGWFSKKHNKPKMPPVPLECLKVNASFKAFLDYFVTRFASASPHERSAYEWVYQRMICIHPAAEYIYTELRAPDAGESLGLIQKEISKDPVKNLQRLYCGLGIYYVADTVIREERHRDPVVNMMGEAICDAYNQPTELIQRFLHLYYSVDPASGGNAHEREKHSLLTQCVFDLLREDLGMEDIPYYLKMEEELLLGEFWKVLGHFVELTPDFLTARNVVATIPCYNG